MPDRPSSTPPPSAGAIGSAAGRGHDARRTLAAAGEQLATDHLQRLGYAIVARNHRTRFGELDIVAADEHHLVFAEVKTRRASAGADPWAALDPRKRAQVRRMAAAYLAETTARPHGLAVRFDAIGVLLDSRDRLVRLEHLEAAF